MSAAVSPYPSFDISRNDRLMSACYGGSMDEARSLLDSGANIFYVCGSHSTTPIMQAAKKNHYLLLDYLLTFARNKLNHSYPEHEAKQRFLDYLNHADNSGLTALMYAARSDPSRPSQQYFTSNGSLLAGQSLYSIPSSAICIDLSLKDDDSVKLLLNAGANVNAMDENGMNALHWSAFESTIKISAYLLRLKSLNINAISAKGSVLNILFYLGNAPMIRRLFEERISEVMDQQWKGLPYFRHPLQHVSGFYHKKLIHFTQNHQLYSEAYLQSYKNTLIQCIERWKESSGARPLIIATIDEVLPINDLAMIIVDYIRIDTELNELIDEFEQKIPQM